MIRIDEEGATVAPALEYGIRSEFSPARVHQPALQSSFLNNSPQTKPFTYTSSHINTW
jgi:hypothetical protein